MTIWQLLSRKLAHEIFRIPLKVLTGLSALPWRAWDRPQQAPRSWWRAWCLASSSSPGCIRECPKVRPPHRGDPRWPLGFTSCGSWAWSWRSWRVTRPN